MDLHIYDHWHYIDFAYTSADFNGTVLPPDDDNLLYGLPLLLNTLRAKATPNLPDYRYRNQQWTKNFAIRFMTHMIGDLHQPVWLFVPWV
jgi:hypothetical protein